MDILPYGKSLIIKNRPRQVKYQLPSFLNYVLFFGNPISKS
jgi:hypothetical protein